MLFSLVEEELELDSWRCYTANILCMIARPNYESEIPLYTDLIEGKKPENNMTADEIYDHIMEKLDELEMKGA